MKPDIAGLIAALSDPRVYPETTTGVRFVQTQMSCVFLTDDYAYKIKKPVNLGYVDYASLEKRRYFCEREIELNRRLCPAAYLGVVLITLDNSEITIDGSGEVLEYAVRMKRLPDDKLLDNLLRQNSVTPEMMNEIARRVAGFHKTAETNPEIAAFGRVATIAQNTEENFSQTEKYVGVCLSQKQYDKLKEFTRGFIRDHAAVLERRSEEGRTRDCHGDLHAAHICFCYDLCVFDCIEFNERFRYCDVASEAAFLAMDLDRYGRADLSRRFTEEYIKQSGDKDIPALLNFYKCYRAYVRGKVACFKLDDPLVSDKEKEESRANAQAYFDLAVSYTRKKPLLVVMVGLTGSGKTTLAAALSQHIGAVHISSDVTRKQLAGIPQTEHRFNEPETGLYSPEMNRKTYDAIFAGAVVSLENKTSVILDAAFLKQAERERAAMMAQELGADLFVIECRLSPELTRKRLEQRLKEASASDGRWEIYQKQSAWFKPVTGIPDSSYKMIDTSAPLAQNIRYVLDRMSE